MLAMVMCLCGMVLWAASRVGTARWTCCWPGQLATVVVECCGGDVPRMQAERDCCTVHVHTACRHV